MSKSESEDAEEPPSLCESLRILGCILGSCPLHVASVASQPGKEAKRITRGQTLG